MKRKSFLPRELRSLRLRPRLKRIAGFTLALFSLATRVSFPQEISPNARQLYQQALADSNLTQKAQLLENALQASPNDFDIHFELGKTLLALKQPQPALVHFDFALSRDLKNPLLWYYKGLAHQQLEQYPPALRSLRIAIGMQEKRADFFLALGKVQLDNNAREEALKTFEQALSLALAAEQKEEQHLAWYWKGRTHEALNDTASAAKSYRQALRLQPDDADAKARLFRWENLRHAQAAIDSAKALLSLRKFDEALSQLQNAFLFDASRADEIQSLVTQIEAEKAREAKPVSAPEVVVENKGESIPPKIDSTAPPVRNPIAESLSTKPDSGLKRAEKPNKKESPLNINTLVILIASATFILIIVVWRIRKSRQQKSVPEASAPDAHVNEDEQVSLSGPMILRNPFPLNQLREVVRQAWEEKSRSLQKPERDPLAGHPRYRIELELGRGGMSCVYRAFDNFVDRDIALKVIKPQSTVNLKMLVQHFYREIDITAKLKHKNIVPLFDRGEWQGEPFFTMEYEEGLTLKELLRVHDRLALAVALHVARETCLALRAAHQRRIIHRDVSPTNIMLDLEGDVKVLDFGIAKIVQEEEQDVTGTQFRPGNPYYASPEQKISSKKLDGRSDIFSLGMVFYEMLAGQKPEVWPNRIHPPLNEIRPELPAQIVAVITNL